MRIVLPGPRDVFRLLTRARETGEMLLELLPRLMTLLDQVEDIVRVLRAIDDVELRIADAVDKTLVMVDRIEPIITEFAPTLKALHPIVQRIAETTDPEEIEAIVKLINDLPELVAKIHVDILPVMSALDTVPNDLRELLITSTELNQIIASVPGLGRMRHRAQREHDEQERRTRALEQAAERASGDRKRPSGES